MFDIETKSCTVGTKNLWANIFLVKIMNKEYNTVQTRFLFIQNMFA